jgi:ribosomal protein S18 acetylase RimI-like enzyme
VVTVRAATAADIPALSGALARAFHDDPVMNWLVPRGEHLTRFFASELRHVYLPKGFTYTTDGLEGGALWAPPGRWKTTTAEVVRSIPALLPVMGRHMVRGLRALGAVEKAHPRERHYYLGTLGTDCDHQGKGIGSALMTPVLERCDAEGVPAYLESSKEGNVPYYQRHGFDVTGTVDLPGGGPRVWLMWRDPRPADTTDR